MCIIWTIGHPSTVEQAPSHKHLCTLVNEPSDYEEEEIRSRTSSSIETWALTSVLCYFAATYCSCTYAATIKLKIELFEILKKKIWLYFQLVTKINLYWNKWKIHLQIMDNTALRCTRTQRLYHIRDTRTEKWYYDDSCYNVKTCGTFSTTVCIPVIASCDRR